MIICLLGLTIWHIISIVSGLETVKHIHPRPLLDRNNMYVKYIARNGTVLTAYTYSLPRKSIIYDIASNSTFWKIVLCK